MTKPLLLPLLVADLLTLSSRTRPEKHAQRELANYHKKIATMDAEELAEFRARRRKYNHTYYVTKRKKERR